MIYLLIILSLMLIILFVIALKLLTAKGKGSVSQETLNTISDLGALKALLSSVENNQKLHNQIMQEMKGLISSDSKVQGKLQEHVVDTLKSIETIRQSHEDFKKREQENRESLKRLEAIIAGTKIKGIAGENILKEILGFFPAKMVESNVKIKGKEVEFGLVLADNKIMPVDSKWAATDLLEEFSKQEDELQRKRISAQIEKIVLKRINEISQYIDPEITTPWAIAAIPDSAYGICKSVHADAYKQNVILISYSMLAPYLLMFFSLHLQYRSSIDINNLTHYMLDIKRHVEKMSEILENKINTASKMISNASEEYKQIIGSIKGSMAAIETQGHLKDEEKPSLRGSEATEAIPSRGGSALSK